MFHFITIPFFKLLCNWQIIWRLTVSIFLSCSVCACLKMVFMWLLLVKTKLCHDSIHHPFVSLLTLHKWLTDMTKLTCKNLRCIDRWRCRKRGSKKESSKLREQEGERESVIICVANVAHEHWWGLTALGLTCSLSWVFISICSTISWSPNPWMRVYCQRRIFFLPLNFILPCSAEGWRNRNQTQARMWDIHRGKTFWTFILHKTG